MRYVKTNFSTLEVTFFPVVVGVPVQNNAGQQGYRPQDEPPSIKCLITGSIAGKQVRSDPFEFKDDGMKEILGIANTMKVNVLDSFNASFDKIANLFPVTADQTGDEASGGLPIYMRPERFTCSLVPGSPNSFVVTVGVYSDSDYTNRKSYLELVFEDSLASLNRVAQISKIKEQRDSEQSIIDQTHPSWEQWTEQQREQLTTYAKANVFNYSNQITDLENQTIGKLDELVGSSSPETELQLAVKEMIAVLCTSILVYLKEVSPEYAGIDVQKIMSEFVIPDTK